jgi:hypothetical protein
MSTVGSDRFFHFDPQRSKIHLIPFIRTASKMPINGTKQIS